MRDTDILYMTRAIRLANLGLYTTRPNPRVGCLLVKNGEIIAEGWHQRAGGPHAERVALDIAGNNAKDSTAYVSLEPCCHYGRTPPCSDALIKAGVARVVAAMLDPNPQVAGKGLAQLAAAGIQVESGLLEHQALALNPGFVKRMTKGLPWVRCKLAMSLDGRTGPASGERQWITSEPARHDVQFLRARADAVITGIGTVLADDPALTVRLNAGELLGLEPNATPQQPLRVVLDSHLRMPINAKILAEIGQTLVLYCAGAAEQKSRLEHVGASVQQLPEYQGRVDLNAALRFLAAQGVNEVLLESGYNLAGAALETGLIDELIIYMAPYLLGDSAMSLLHLPHLNGGRQRMMLDIMDIRAVGTDWRITARPKPSTIT